MRFRFWIRCHQTRLEFFIPDVYFCLIYQQLSFFFFFLHVKLRPLSRVWPSYCLRDKLFFFVQTSKNRITVSLEKGSFRAFTKHKNYGNGDCSCRSFAEQKWQQIHENQQGKPPTCFLFSDHFPPSPPCYKTTQMKRSEWFQSNYSQNEQSVLFTWYTWVFLFKHWKSSIKASREHQLIKMEPWRRIHGDLNIWNKILKCTVDTRLIWDWMNINFKVQ